MIKSELKVDFISSLYGVSYVGGVEISTRLLHEAMLPRLGRVRLFTTRRGPSTVGVATSIPHGHWIHDRLFLFGNSIVDRFIAANLEKVVSKELPDIICTHDEFIVPAAVRVAKRLSIPIVAIVRNNLIVPDSAMRSTFSFFAPLVTLPIKRRGWTLVRCCQEADMVITNSEFVARESIAHGLDKRRVKALGVAIVPNWPEPKKHKSKEITVLAPGRLEKGKGFDTVIRAMRIVVRKKKDIRLSIVGDGRYRSNLERLVRRSGLSNYVELRGKVPFETMQRLYAESDIITFSPYVDEPFGRVALEAMASGKPVLASKIGGIPEIVEDGVTGLLLPPSNPEKWAEAILNLAEDELTRLRMGEAGRKVALTKFNIDNIADQLVELLESVVKQRILGETR